jgi:hypothetical protein
MLEPQWEFWLLDGFWREEMLGKRIYEYSLQKNSGLYLV